MPPLNSWKEKTELIIRNKCNHRNWKPEQKEQQSSSSLGKIFSRRHIEIFFLLFPIGLNMF